MNARMNAGIRRIAWCLALGLVLTPVATLVVVVLGESLAGKLPGTKVVHSFGVVADSGRFWMVETLDAPGATEVWAKPFATRELAHEHLAKEERVFDSVLRVSGDWHARSGSFSLPVWCDATRAALEPADPAAIKPPVSSNRAYGVPWRFTHWRAQETTAGAGRRSSRSGVLNLGPLSLPVIVHPAGLALDVVFWAWVCGMIGLGVRAVRSRRRGRSVVQQ
jgi:hypothetical protein